MTPNAKVARRTAGTS